ncbi:hypothetical protein B0H67DRAFT_647085 [Lasiosphaeris hirsuta]|uniref:Uncharacterized protein n=1 Tax=Lasiosphaeris hirsuta TaxID=260670 RepID=A0AA40A9G0_9PEZI|nr:hypothetical protein B0H67DRAFT_647085 [Lasiosphaeris hirsuta]
MLPDETTAFVESGKLCRGERCWETFKDILEPLGAGDAKACLEFMTALCPNLKCLEAVIDLTLKFDGSDSYDVPRLFKFCKPQAMQVLSKLTVSVKASWQSIDLWQILDLLRAPPNLTAPPASFEIFRVFTNLETSAYQSELLDEGLIEEANPFFVWDIWNLVFQYAPNLKTFTLDLGGVEID